MAAHTNSETPLAKKSGAKYIAPMTRGVFAESYQIDGGWGFGK
jgi:hypothetical protein